MNEFEEYRRYKDLIEEHIIDFLPEIDQKSIVLYESMRYSLKTGGKRVRPVLLLAACEFAGGDVVSALPYACAVEYIHTYSLIHDDLPSIDNDDLRRGQPTNHKVYGDGMALLAGDGLLTSAFETMNRDMLLYFDEPEKLKARARASFAISKGAGCRGMIAGQVADIDAEDKTVSKELLDYIHVNKTADLIIAGVQAGAYLGGVDKEMLTRLEDYAENLGLAFQIEDDILDVVGSEEETGKKPGSDEKLHKNTYPSLYGLDASRKKLEELTSNAIEILAPYYDNAEFFVKIAQILKDRRR